MKLVTIENPEKTKKVEITRVKLTDGYNYYLTLYIYNFSFNCYLISFSFKQIESITSKSKAIAVAEKLIN
jgi:hypothetical protein